MPNKTKSRNIVYTKNTKWNKVKTLYFREIARKKHKLDGTSKQKLFFMISDYVEVYKYPKFGFFNYYGEDVTVFNFAFFYLVFTLSYYRD